MMKIQSWDVPLQVMLLAGFSKLHPFYGFFLEFTSTFTCIRLQKEQQRRHQSDFWSHHSGRATQEFQRHHILFHVQDFFLYFQSKVSSKPPTVSYSFSMRCRFPTDIFRRSTSKIHQNLGFFVRALIQETDSDSYTWEYCLIPLFSRLCPFKIWFLQETLYCQQCQSMWS